MRFLWTTLLLLHTMACQGASEPDPLSNDAGAQYRCDPDPPAPDFSHSSQTGNPGYCPEVPSPAYPFGQGPRVMFDEGHHNFGTITPSPDSPAAGRYYALAELLRADGFVVEPLSGPLDAASLADANLLILCHALPAPYVVYDEQREKWVYNPSAFDPLPAYSQDEIAAVADWVSAGGSLLINSEHLPFTGAMASLAASFDVSLDASALGVVTNIFQKSTPSHPIFLGRNDQEHISAVPYVAGGSQLLSDTATPLFECPAVAVGTRTTAEAYMASFEYIECMEENRPQAECDTYAQIRDQGLTTYNAGGDVVAMTHSHGSGRVAVFTEFATFTSQLIDDDNDGVVDSEYGGLIGGDADTTLLVLNTFRWLAFAL